MTRTPAEIAAETAGEIVRSLGNFAAGQPADNRQLHAACLKLAGAVGNLAAIHLSPEAAAAAAFDDGAVKAVTDAAAEEAAIADAVAAEGVEREDNAVAEAVAADPTNAGSPAADADPGEPETVVDEPPPEDPQPSA